MTDKAKTRKYFKSVQGNNFNEKTFNRLWKTTTQHIRRVGGSVTNPSLEARYHLTGMGRESILDLTYSIGGARGQKDFIRETFEKKLVDWRTQSFREKYGEIEQDGLTMNEWYNLYQSGVIDERVNRKVTREDFYNKIDLFRETNKKYNSTGSK